MKAPMLSAVLLALFTCVSSGVWMDDEVTPENINEKSYKFTLDVTGTKKGGRIAFKLTIETKDGRTMPDNTDVQLTV